MAFANLPDRFTPEARLVSHTMLAPCLWNIMDGCVDVRYEANILDQGHLNRS